MSSILVDLIVLGSLGVVFRPGSIPEWAVYVLVVGGTTHARIAPALEAVGIALILWLLPAARTTQRTKILLGAVGALALWEAALIFHPNVPNMMTGVLGWRKAVLSLAGIALAVASPERARLKLRTKIPTLLSALLWLSIGVHLLAPSYESEASASADLYTGLYRGSVRAVGIFAGPFHLSLAASAGMALALAERRLSRAVRYSLATAAVIAMISSQVRTGYVAAAIIIFAVLPLRRIRRQLLIFATLTIALVFIAGQAGYRLSRLSAVENLTPAIASVFRASEDTRFAARGASLSEGLSALGKSPVFGYGAGSAGDTLGRTFGYERYHLTAHNLFLKYFIEGGIFGGILGLIPILMLSYLVMRWSGSVERMLLAVYVLFALTGSIAEALPVSTILLIRLTAGIKDAHERIGGMFGEQFTEIAYGSRRLGANRGIAGGYTDGVHAKNWHIVIR